MEINQSLNALASIVLAKAMKDLYPQIILGESNVDENGFSYSFASDTPISIKDLPKILKQMRKNIDRNYLVKYALIDATAATKLFSKEKYKLAIIASLPQVSVVKFGEDFVDICPQMDIVKLATIKAIKLFNVSGVY
jgi:threonyl-tRNA synthetase